MTGCKGKSVCQHMDTKLNAKCVAYFGNTKIDALAMICIKALTEPTRQPIYMQSRDHHCRVSVSKQTLYVVSRPWLHVFNMWCTIINATGRLTVIVVRRIEQTGLSGLWQQLLNQILRLVESTPHTVTGATTSAFSIYRPNPSAVLVGQRTIHSPT